MKNSWIFAMLLFVVASFVSCSDDDSFSLSTNHLLTFSADTVKLDTVFSNVPTPTKTLWVFNRSGDGIRCVNVRLERGNQTGFRVNVDGTYLGEASGFQTSNVEIRNKDSIRVFVELTSPLNYSEGPVKLNDNLLFTLESGVVQKVALSAFTWDAQFIDHLHVKGEQTLQGEKPIVVYGGITVDSTATLTIAPGTTLYFHNDAGIDVYGRLLCKGEANSNVTLRGDRIDRMFAYLPYDFVSGQWQGIRIHSSSYGNQLDYTDIHSTFNGIVIDSCDVASSSLEMNACTVHNCQGYGILADHCKLSLTNCQISNTLGDCLFVNGGEARVASCTLAQFYPFDSNRGVALRFRAEKEPLAFECLNTLVTGYADDELMGERADTATVFDYRFSHCVLRTPKVETDDSVRFVNVMFEDPKDTTNTGKKHFLKIDTENLRYDFRLDSTSVAIGRADAATSLPVDRNGATRDDKPDIGAYEYAGKP